MLALHAPDGFLSPGVALATGVIAVLCLGWALRRVSADFDDRQIPLAGVTAAFIFAAQMFNFPVAAGTTGHLVGGALAAILLGPAMGSIVVAIVVIVQALLFADGGLSALGYNLINMAIVPAFGGWAIFSWARKVLANSASGVIGASGIAAWASVVLAAIAFSIQWLFGATAPVPFDTVFGAMVGVHTLIGIGEAVLTALVIAAVLGTRPDLVVGASDLDAEQLRERPKVSAPAFAIGATLVALTFAVVVSQFAVDNPDGLERVAEEHGFIDQARDHAFANGLFADYATSGIANETLSLATAGVAGTILTLAVAYGAATATVATRRSMAS